MPNLNLKLLLPSLTPKVIAWATEQEERLCRGGTAMPAELLQLAREVGVAYPERIRVSQVERVPSPTDTTLRHAADALGMLGAKTAGLTLGYAVFVVRSQLSKRLLSHEFRHVHQYETAGGIAAFMPEYLQQLMSVGYFDAPYERDARAHEIADQARR